MPPQPILEVLNHEEEQSFCDETPKDLQKRKDFDLQYLS